MLLIKRLFSYSTDGVQKGDPQMHLQLLLLYCCYTMKKYQDTPIHQQSQEIRKTEVVLLRCQELRTQYLVRHIDVYQVNNAGNFDIHARDINLPK